MKENFVVSFEKNHVAQANLVKAENGKQARDYFSYQNPKAHIYGVRIGRVCASRNASRRSSRWMGTGKKALCKFILS